MQTLLMFKHRAAGLLLLSVCAFFSAAANAQFDTYMQVQTANNITVVNVGDEFTVRMDFTNSYSSASTAFSPNATLNGLGSGGFSIRSTTSMTLPSSCGHNTFTAWCSIGSLAPGATFTSEIGLKATTPGVYTLTATGTPYGTASYNNVADLVITVNTPPEVTITGPADEMKFPSDTIVTLTATAYDQQDGDIASQLTWWSNLIGHIGSGSTVTASLPDGRHSISATLTDSNGVSSSDLFQIIIEDIAIDSPVIRTIAGSDLSGYSGDGGQARAAKFSGIRGATRTPQGDIYIIDGGNSAIRKIDPNGVVTTVYSGQMYSNITAITSDALGNVYWANNDADYIKKLTPNGVLSTAAGGGGVQPQEGFPAANVYFDGVTDLAVNAQGEIFIVVPFRHQIYRVGTDNLVHVAAGNGVNNLYPVWGSQAVNSPISYPSHIALDAFGNLYISQNLTNFERVLKVDAAGVLTRYAGAGARGFDGDFGPAADALLSYPTDLVVDPNNDLLILDQGNYRIRKVDSGGTIVTLYGTGSSSISGDGGFAAEAGLGGIGDLDIAADGELLIANVSQLRLISLPYEVDLALSAQGNPAVPEGGSAAITYTVSNNRDEPVENVILNVFSENVITAGGAGWNCTTLSFGMKIRCSFDRLEANAGVQIQVQASVQPVPTNTVWAEVSSYFNEVNSSDNTVVFNYFTNDQPMVILETPQSGANYLETDSIPLLAIAFDEEDGWVSADIQWHSSISGFLGQGSELAVNLSPGEHILTASVTDSGGLQGQAEVSITVQDVNMPPVISILAPADQSSISVDASPIAFNINATDSEDGNIASQVTLLSSIDGVISSPAALSVGTHTITASVTDSGGLSASAGITVTITPHVNVKPQLSISSPVNGQTVLQSSMVTLTAQASDLEDGNLSAAISWQSSLDGPIVSPVQLSLGTHTLTASVTDSGGLTGSASVQITVANTLPYCNSRGNNANYEWVAAVSVGGVNHVSGKNNGYLDATTRIFNAQAGSSTPIVLTPGSTYSVSWAVWVDFNRNQVFDTNERLYTGAGTTVRNGTITIPAGTAVGQTRMRVSLKYGSTIPQPCETFTYGEVEDYTVNIQPGLPYQLSSTSSHVVTRTGTTADNVHWVVEENGVIVFSGAVASLSYQYPSHLAGRQYRIWLRDPVSLATASNVVTYTFGVQPALPPLCSSNGSNANLEWINSVAFGSYVNTSGKNGGYLNVTAPVQLNSRSISATFQSGGGYSEYWAVFVDINRDGQLTADEQIHTHSGVGSRTVTLNFPSTVSSGQYRMRVSMRYGTSPAACGSFTYGEVEDYLIQFNL